MDRIGYIILLLYLYMYVHLRHFNKDHSINHSFCILLHKCSVLHISHVIELKKTYLFIICICYLKIKFIILDISAYILYTELVVNDSFRINNVDVNADFHHFYIILHGANQYVNIYLSIKKSGCIDRRKKYPVFPFRFRLGNPRGPYNYYELW